MTFLILSLLLLDYFYKQLSWYLSCIFPIDAWLAFEPKSKDFKYWFSRQVVHLEDWQNTIFLPSFSTQHGLEPD